MTSALQGPAEPLGTVPAILALLSAASCDEPLLVVIDDAQWIDPSSLAILEAVGRRLENEPRLPRDGATRLAPAGSRPPAKCVVQLDGLSPLDAVDLIRDIVAEPVAELLARQTLGHPLMMLEMAELMTGPQPAGTDTTWELRELPAVLREVYRNRTMALDHGQHGALLIAATEGGLTVEELQGAASSVCDAAAVGELVRPGLLRVDPNGALDFEHPLLRQTAIMAVSPDEVSAAHSMLAEHYAVLDAERHGWHLAESVIDGPDEHVATRSTSLVRWPSRAPTTSRRPRRSNRPRNSPRARHGIGGSSDPGAHSTGPAIRATCCECLPRCAPKPPTSSSRPTSSCSAHGGWR